MDRREFLTGPANDLFVHFHDKLNEINAPQEIHDEYSNQYSELLLQLFIIQDYVERMKDVIVEKYGEEACKEIVDIAIERLNIDYDYPATNNGIRKKEGNILMFPGVIWNEDKEKEKDKEE